MQGQPDRHDYDCADQHIFEGPAEEGHAHFDLRFCAVACRLKNVLWIDIQDFTYGGIAIGLR
jgi:hypothetical protein